MLQTGLRRNEAKRDDISYLRTKNIKIKTNPPQKIVLDGEMIGYTPLEVECIQNGLQVIVPMQSGKKDVS